jgi:hypothetical protein
MNGFLLLRNDGKHFSAQERLGELKCESHQPSSDKAREMMVDVQERQ